MAQTVSANAALPSFFKEEPLDEAGLIELENVEASDVIYIKQEMALHSAFDVKHENNESSHSLAFPCSYCEYKTNASSNLDEHIKVHKPFRCVSCNFKCSDRSGLDYHFRTHTEAKPFACNLCEYRARQIRDLTTHMKTHADPPRTISCAECKYVTKYKRIMKQHMKFHENEKPFRCGYCTFKCKYRCNLQRHLRIHTGDKPYKCDLCEYRATQRSQVKTHMKTHQNLCVCYLCGRKAQKKPTDSFYDAMIEPFMCEECRYDNKDINSECNADGDVIYHSLSMNDIDGYSKCVETVAEAEPSLDLQMGGFEVKIEMVDVDEQNL